MQKIARLFKMAFGTSTAEIGQLIAARDATEQGLARMANSGDAAGMNALRAQLARLNGMIRGSGGDQSAYPAIAAPASSMIPLRNVNVNAGGRFDDEPFSAFNADPSDLISPTGMNVGNIGRIPQPPEKGFGWQSLAGPGVGGLGGLMAGRYLSGMFDDDEDVQDEAAREEARNSNGRRAAILGSLGALGGGYLGHRFNPFTA